MAETIYNSKYKPKSWVIFFQYIITYKISLVLVI